SGAIYYPMDITLRDRESGDDGTEDESSGPGRIDGLLRAFEHRSRRDSELLGEGLRLAFRLGEIPDGRVPLVPDARRRPRRNSTGSGQGNAGEHELRSSRSTNRSRTWRPWGSSTTWSPAWSRRRRSSTATTCACCTTW